MESKIIKNKIGAHLSIRGTILNPFEEAEALGIKNFACFTGSNLRYTLSTHLAPEVVRAFRAELAEKKYLAFSHACYLINIASKEKGETYSRSIEAVCAELTRCSALGIAGAVIHPGSNVDRAQGLELIASTINGVMDGYDGSSELLLESSAGQGNTLPTSLEELKSIYDGLTDRSRAKTKFVIDTCHFHAAGYDLSTAAGVDRFLTEFDRVVGLGKLALIHLNDSKKPSGSRIDRHESIGRGTIGCAGIAAFINDRRVVGIPKILETPVESYLDWRVDLEVLEGLLQ